MRIVSPRVLPALVAAVAVLVSGTVSEAQMQSGPALAVRLSGRVEVLNVGQKQWVPLAPGSALTEGAQVRSFSGGSAELAMPDGSTVLVAENTRYALVKMQVDPRTGDRNILSHLVVGKVRANVRRAALALARTRQVNFAISTPGGVAAVRGTEIVLAYDPATNTGLLFVLPSPGEPAALASATYFDFTTRTQQVVAAGSFVSHVVGQLPSQAVPISTLPQDVQRQITTPTNPSTVSSPALTQVTVVIVSAAVIQQALVTLGAPVAPPPPPSQPAPPPLPPPSPAPPPPAAARPVSGQ